MGNQKQSTDNTMGNQKQSTDNTMAKRTRTKGQTMNHKTSMSRSREDVIEKHVFQFIPRGRAK
jgi:hypothetical protein